MSSFGATIFFGVATLLAIVSAQQSNCGCAQPTVIQLSCGSNGRGPVAPPPTGGADAMGAGATGHENYTPEEIQNMCDFDENGYPTSHPPGGFPVGFHIPRDENGYPSPVAPAGFPVPPSNWDGRMETLGFPMPQPGTAHYNMLMCIPISVVAG